MIDAMAVFHATVGVWCIVSKIKGGREGGFSLVHL